MKKPAFNVTISGTRITALSSIQVIDSAGKEDMCELKVAKSDSTPTLLVKGASVDIELGYDFDLTWVGRFFIDDIGFESSKSGFFYCVRARAVPHAEGSEVVAITKTWEPGTIGGLVASIAAKNNLRPLVGAIGAQPLKLIHQRAESDLAFLDRLAKQVGCVSKIKGSLWVFKRMGEELGDAFPRVIKDQSQLISYAGTPIKERFAFKGVRAFWYDTDLAELMPVEVGESPFCEIKHTCRDEAGATEAAMGRLTLFSAKAGQFKAQLPGDPVLMAEGMFIVRGAEHGFNHTWRLTQVTHTLTKAGFVSTVEGELPNSASETEGDSTPEEEP